MPMTRHLLKACHRIMLRQDITIPPKSVMDLNGLLVYSHVKNRSNSWITTAVEPVRGLHLANTLVSDAADGKGVILQAINVAGHPIEFKAGKHLCMVQEVLQQGELINAEKGLERDIALQRQIEIMVAQADATVNDTNRDQLRQLLRKYSDVISIDEMDLGRTIETGAARPTRQT